MRRMASALSMTGAALLVGFWNTGTAQDAYPGSIEQITDNLYRAANTTHRAVFLVTDDGIILADPINREFSTWLRGEIDARFGLPVRYVLYTHHHWDHASGGAVWEDTAEFIGHENMLTRLALPPAGTLLPAAAAEQDANGDGEIGRAEASGAFATNFALYDFDGDDVISGAEATRGPLNDVRRPDITYSDTMTVRLGGHTAEAVYTGIHTHTDDMSVVVFPGESVGFMADFISIVRPPRWIRGDRPVDSWIAAVRLVEAQGFDIAVGGHGAYADSMYVTLFRKYLEQLRDAVSAGIEAGQSLEAMQDGIYMDAYADWISYDEFRASNIADMYNLLTADF